MKYDKTAKPAKRLNVLPVAMLLFVVVLLGWVGSALWNPSPTPPAPQRDYQPTEPPLRDKPSAAAPRLVFPDVRLSLSGITRRGNDAVALIGAEGHEPQYYAVGQEIAAEITVRSILPDRVVLGYHDLLKTLYLKARSADATGKATRTASFDPDAEDEGYKEKNPNIDPASLTIKRITAAKEFLREVVLAPDPRGGFVVKEVTPGSVYEQMGLRVGDILYSIDTPANRDIDESSMEFMIRQVELQLEVYRNGNFVLLRRALNE
ncbi:MAG: type II secretion system protein N [Sulfurifustis sp.]